MKKIKKGFISNIGAVLICICFLINTMAYPSFALRNNFMFDKANVRKYERRVMKATKVLANYMQRVSMSRERFLELVGLGSLSLAVLGCEPKEEEHNVYVPHVSWEPEYEINVTRTVLVKGCDGVSMNLFIDESEIINQGYLVDNSVYDLLMKIFNSYPIGSIGPYVNNLAVVFVKSEIYAGSALAKGADNSGVKSKSQKIISSLSDESRRELEQRGMTSTVDGKLILYYPTTIDLNKEKGTYEIANRKLFILTLPHELFHFIYYSLYRLDEKRWKKFNDFPRWIITPSNEFDMSYVVNSLGSVGAPDDFAYMGEEYFYDTLGNLRKYINSGEKNEWFFKKYYFIADVFSHTKNEKEVTWVSKVIDEVAEEPVEIIIEEHEVVRNSDGDVIEIKESLVGSAKTLRLGNSDDFSRRGFLSILLGVPGSHVRQAEAGI
jgi:hypothetical protein